jgi:hypothetical protein
MVQATSCGLPPPPLAGSFGPDEVSWIVRRRLRGHPQTPACEAASCTSRSGTPRVERGGDERVPQRVQRFPVTGIEAPRVPPGPSSGRGRRRPGHRPARSDEMSNFAAAGGTGDPIQCAGGRGTLRSARSALSVSGPAQASAANHIGGYASAVALTTGLIWRRSPETRLLAGMRRVGRGAGTDLTCRSRAPTGWRP